MIEEVDGYNNQGGPGADNDFYLHLATRKVASITEQLCGTAITSTQVSQAAAQLDETLEAWRNRPLDVPLSVSGCSL